MRKPKIIQIIKGYESEAWPLTVLGLADDGCIYYIQGDEPAWKLYQGLHFAYVNGKYCYESYD